MSGNSDLLEALLRDIRAAHADVDEDVITRAFRLADDAHGDQLRRSGEPYVTHPVAVARIVVDLLKKLADTEILAAAILHDVVEDTEEKLEDVRRIFGEEVALLVDGVTKITGLEFTTTEAEQSENFRKMLLSMAKDVRVILIKLADRLHNMRTLDHLSEDRRRAIAQETRDIYAPLAHRLGIAKVKWEMEDLTLKHLDPEAYRKLAKLVAERREEREMMVAEIISPIRDLLQGEKVPAEITGRPKHFDSIYRKMKRQRSSLDAIYDLIGVRVIAQSKTDCYRALGVIHDLYKPVPDRFKDYIATPKSNLYQSLHTTVIGPGGRFVEVQIRTADMHRIAEYGIAAHYSYKEGIRPEGELDEKLGGLVGGTREFGDSGDPDEYMEFLRTSLYQDEVFVFTPRGDLRQLPKGATALDFAFLIHTEVGQKTVGSRVNGRLVPLRYELQNGDTVEMITQASAHPSESWLGILKTSRARQKVRHWLKEQRREDSISLGREILGRELKRLRKPAPTDRQLGDVAQSFGLENGDLLLAQLGQGDLSAASVAPRLYPELEEERTKRPSTLTKLKELTSREPKGIRLQDVDNLMVRLAKCCQPVPGDQILGMVTRGRGLSVHRVDCPNVFEDRLEAERRVDVSWDVAEARAFVVKVLVYGEDRPGLLADVANALSAEGSNILNAGMRAVDGDARGTFLVEVNNLNHLTRVLKAITRIKGVRAAERAQSGGE